MSTHTLPLILLPLLAVSLAGCSSATDADPLGVAEFELGIPYHMSSIFVAGQDVDLLQLVAWAKDGEGKELSGAALARIPGARIRWAWHDRHPDALTRSLEEHDGDGWTALAPEYLEAGFIPNGSTGYDVRLHVWITDAGPKPLDGWGGDRASP